MQSTRTANSHTIPTNVRPYTSVTVTTVTEENKTPHVTLTLNQMDDANPTFHGNTPHGIES